ncbi:hypothetical protein Tcan_05897 [Toxocara canis]|uniref:G-protein coupled receptors family 1 profile domain-containing protein n=1 Tax=Toxocara canis TaxID=6265 RepID=A0A0B2VAT9_TOXCA|nr:hypothetical protein Tcan_05897 [Toxocara canis]
MCDGGARLFDTDDPYTVSFIRGLQEFSRYYSSVHGGICMVICVFGIISNLVHILVLTRAPLRRCAVNCVLTAVAVCDVLTMSSYIVYLLRFRFLANEEGYSYIWIAYLLSHAVFTIALHSITLYMGVALAFIRWQALGNVQSKWLLPSSAWKMFGISTVVVSVLCIPTMLVHTIVKMPMNALPSIAEPATLIVDQLYTLDMVQDACSLFQVNLWLTAIFLKAIPCVLLLWFTFALVSKLRDTDIKRNDLYSKSFRKHMRKTTVPDKTTYMLVIMISVFLATELPQGFLALLNGVYAADVHRFIYVNVGDLLDLLSLLNCSVDCFLYCAMSSRYRHTFNHILIRAESWLRKKKEERLNAKEWHKQYNYSAGQIVAV